MIFKVVFKCFGKIDLLRDYSPKVDLTAPINLPVSNR